VLPVPQSAAAANVEGWRFDGAFSIRAVEEQQVHRYLYVSELTKKQGDVSRET